MLFCTAPNLVFACKISLLLAWILIDRFSSYGKLHIWLKYMSIYFHLHMQVTGQDLNLVPRCRRVYSHAHDYHINSISNNRLATFLILWISDQACNFDSCSVVLLAPNYYTFTLLIYLPFSSVYACICVSLLICALFPVWVLWTYNTTSVYFQIMSMKLISCSHVVLHPVTGRHTYQQMICE